MTRPIEDHERPHLEALGADLRRSRLAVGLSQADLALLAELSPHHIWQLEKARRRTRRMTLARIAHALAEASDNELTEQELLASFLAHAGPALAPDLAHPERWGKKRARRQRRREAIQAEAAALAREMTARALQYRGWHPDTIRAALTPDEEPDPAPPPPRFTSPTPARLRKKHR